MISETRDVIHHVLPQLHGRVLDLGAGTAKYRALIEPCVASYHAMDLVPSLGVSVAASALRAPLAGESFDVVLCNQMLEHVTEPWTAVGEIFRLLRPGGLCVATAPFLLPYHADPHDYYRYTEEGFRHLFAAAGFIVQECAGYGRAGTVVAESLHHVFLSPYRRVRWPGETRLLCWLAAAGRLADRCMASGRIYANVYLVARKA
jgi:SAM-dependent methyltransferase